MKINKILAAGMAATLAVTSLGVVTASATEVTKSFDMTQTVTKRKLNDVLVTFLGDNSEIKAKEKTAAADGTAETEETTELSTKSANQLDTLKSFATEAQKALEALSKAITDGGEALNGANDNNKIKDNTEAIEDILKQIESATSYEAANKAYVELVKDGAKLASLTSAGTNYSGKTEEVTAAAGKIVTETEDTKTVKGKTGYKATSNANVPVGEAAAAGTVGNTYKTASSTTKVFVAGEGFLDLYAFASPSAGTAYAPASGYTAYFTTDENSSDATIAADTKIYQVKTTSPDTVTEYEEDTAVTKALADADGKYDDIVAAGVADAAAANKWVIKGETALQTGKLTTLTKANGSLKGGETAAKAANEAAKTADTFTGKVATYIDQTLEITSKDGASATKSSDDKVEYEDLISEGGILNLVSNETVTIWGQTSANPWYQKILKKDGTVDNSGLGVAGGYIKVTGMPVDSTTQVTQTYNMVNNGTTNWKPGIKFTTGYINTPGCVNLNAYQKITRIEVYANFEYTCNTAAEYAARGSWCQPAVSTRGLVKITHDGVSDENLGKIFDAFDDGTDTGDYKYYGATDEKKDYYAFLEKTTDDATIYRKDVQPLSVPNAWNAQSTAAGEITTDKSQTYDENNMGTSPRYFAGLSSQVADFFNKKTNGKITFKFLDTATIAEWKNGGIPSTEVGLKNALASTSMGIFFNYNSSTGSLYSIGEVDADAKTITFDISEILNDMGGLTKGNVQDIYYGMNKGIAYNNGDYKSDHAAVKGEDESVDDTAYDNGTLWYNTESTTDRFAVGYLIDEVILSYDDAAAASSTDADTTDVTDTSDNDDEDDVADNTADDEDDVDDTDDWADDEDDDDADDEDDDATLEDDDDDEDDVANAIDDNTPVEDDANPGTGAGLAVIPAIVAAAAMVVSKKRK